MANSATTTLPQRLSRFARSFRIGTDRVPRFFSLAIALLALAVCVTTAALVWLGYVATREWRRGTELLQQRRSTETLALATVAITRDMRGFAARVLVPLTQTNVDEEPPHEMLRLTARGFARFPYVESFLVWRNRADAAETVRLFNRTDRPPEWSASSVSADPFPVTLLTQAPAFRDVIARIRAHAGSGQAFVLEEMSIAGVPYQVVAHLMINSERPDGLAGFAAFTVNLDWVRTLYFEPLLRQVVKIGGDDQSLVLSVRDDAGLTIAATGLNADDAGLRRTFPLWFIEPATVSHLQRDTPMRQWSVHVHPGRDRTVAAAGAGAGRAFLLMSLAGSVCILALILTINALRGRARGIAAQMDFVSTVTHELKTPLASMQLVSDTLASGRYSSTNTVQEYAGLLSLEAARLTRSIDNLLAYARYSARTIGPAEARELNVGHLIDEAIERLAPRLAERQFEVSVDVPEKLPRIFGDRTALLQVFDNLIDNAIRYSRDRNALAITASCKLREVSIVVSDQGIGIPAQDLPRVFERFFRAGNAKGNGSGLGLAIAHRIIGNHRGRLSVRSQVGQGTDVEILLPIDR